MDQGVLLVCHVDGDELSSFSNPSFTVHHCTSLPTSAVSASACLLAGSNRNDMFQKTREVRMKAPTTFIIFYHQDATEDALLREEAFECGANMVTCYVPHVQEALNRVAAQQLQGNITCPWCGLQGLTPESFYLHQPLYHIYHANIDGYCPIKACRASTSNLARHLHHMHPPPGQKVEERTGVFALVVVRRPSDGRFLLVQEFAGQGYWLPGGGVDRGESLQDGAIREALEEAGVLVKLKGVLNVEVLGSWRRIIFYAEPAVNPQTQLRPASQSAPSGSTKQEEMSSLGWPKTVPDFESAGACYVSAEQLESIPLRSASELRFVKHVAEGGPIAPLELPKKYTPYFADFSF